MKKKIIYFKLIAIIFIIQGTFTHAAIQNKILATVGGEIVSSFELKNKIRINLFLGNLELSQENINNTKNQPMLSLIDYKIKQEEVKKYKVAPNQQGLSKHINKISKKYNTDVQGLKKLFESNGLNFELFMSQTEAEFAWQQLIFNIYQNKISINEKEIREEQDIVIKNQKNFEEFNLAEIEILLENDIDNKKKFKEISDQINLIGFENTAIKHSSSSSSVDGGNLGWISSKTLSNEILKIVKEMKIGEISIPIIRTNTAMYIKLLEKRSLKKENIDLEKLKQQIINNKKNELLNLFSRSHLSKIKNNTLIEIK